MGHTKVAVRKGMIHINIPNVHVQPLPVRRFHSALTCAYSL
jgi:hypothetical protein